ncbi:AAA family ATPase [Leptospira yasudae]|uniref:AAA family ATPase n=1 Tax=Leptospira yasudae TaxID=2202201 RepID=UPI001090C0CA|nr:AAA family ATPase [Leptospira yasudae]TGM99937.1 ATPase [Leptospira yasudae]
MISEFRVERFKNIKDTQIALAPINIIVGGNNAGKTSLLQSIQFGVSVAQTTNTQNAYWSNDKLSTSVSPNQLIYSPINDIYALGYGGYLREGFDREIKLTYFDDSQISAIVSIKKGRNKNVLLDIQGETVGKQFQDLSSPYSVFAPGLAGIPLEERFANPAVVRKAIARGDANLYLRNIINQLSSNVDSWNAFLTDLRTIFPNFDVKISFNMETDEAINVQVVLPDETILPIESSGTGMLQAIQIIAYINLFKPKLLILDEPDSHLHPNNQRLLCYLLENVTKREQVKIIISTHSRHIIDSLSNSSQIIWIQNGEKSKVASGYIPILLDLGALDKSERFRTGQLSYVVLTEDAYTDPISTLIEAAGADKNNFEIWSYKGCTNIESAIVLLNFIKEHAANTKVIIHRDRDFMTDQEVADYKNEFSNAANTLVFVTEKNDIESYYLNSNHILSLYPELPLDNITEYYNDSIIENRDKSLEKMINSRIQREQIRARKENRQVNSGEVARLCNEQYNNSPERASYGKGVLGSLTAKIQKKIRNNPKLFQVSEHIVVEELKNFIL